MVRKLAVAAAVIGACAFITPTFGKGGAAAPGYTGLAPAPRAPHASMRARTPLYTGLAPAFRARHHGHFGHHFAGHGFHRHGFGLGSGYGYVPPVADAVIYVVPEDKEPAPGAVAVWNGNTKAPTIGTGGCNAEVVQVRGARGMDNLTITRC
jgi:hypothetical protein